jgi:Flp pilus assembly protein TadD
VLGIVLVVLLLGLFFASRTEAFRLWLLSLNSLENVRASVSADSTDVGGWAVYARKLAESGDQQGAAKAYEQAVSALNPNDESARARSIVPGAAHAIARFGDVDTAADLVERAKKLAPEHFETLMASGIVAMRREAFADAEASFDRATKADPSRGEAWNRLGTCLLGQGKAVPAETPLKRAVELMPKDAPAHADLGEAFLQQGRFKEAKEQFAAAAAIKPDAPEYLTQHALASAGGARSDEEYEEAATLLVTAMQASPDDVAIPLHLAGLQMKFGRMEEAKRSYEMVVAATPDHSDAWFNLSNVYTRLGDRASASVARTRFQRLLDRETRVVELTKQTLLHPQDARLQATLSEALRAMGDDVKAYRALQRACELAPNDAKLRAKLEEATQGMARARAAGRMGTN